MLKNLFLLALINFQRLSTKIYGWVFKRNSSLHQRHTRYSDESKLITPHRKYDYGQNCLSYRGATIWNSLEISIKEAKSCNTFKHLVKARFFRNLKLKEENIYIFWLLFFYCCSVDHRVWCNFSFILSFIRKKLLEGTTMEINNNLSSERTFLCYPCHIDLSISHYCMFYVFTSFNVFLRFF